jgi:hypothetical protein
VIGEINMKSIAAILLLAASALAQVVHTGRELEGTWRLVSMEDTMTDGSVKPPERLGAHAIGFLMYEPDGHMCASIMNPDRRAWKDSGKPTNEEKIAYFDTLVAYCGSYKLDYEKSVVTHYPEVAWTPSYVGSKQVRPFKLEGKRLTITVTDPLPGVSKRVLVWERAQ